MSIIKEAFFKKTHNCMHRCKVNLADAAQCYLDPDVMQTDQNLCSQSVDMIDETYRDIVRSPCGVYELEKMLESGMSMHIYSDDVRYVRLLTLKELHLIH